MPTLIITVDLECCRCSTKIQKILCSIQERGEFIIEKIVYEKDKVIVSGPFDADKLSSKLCCKAGKIIKNIEVAKPPPPKPDKPPEPPKPNPKPEPVSCKVIYPYPCPYSCPQQPVWPCGCLTPHCGCLSKPPTPKADPKPPEPKSEPKPEPVPPKMIYPYPYPYPYPWPQPGWPCSCPTAHCECQSKPPPAPAPAPPPPEPPKLPACQCPTWSPCYCSGYPPYMPPAMPYPMVVCDDSPPYGACTVM